MSPFLLISTNAQTQCGNPFTVPKKRNWPANTDFFLGYWEWEKIILKSTYNRKASEVQMSRYMISNVTSETYLVGQPCPLQNKVFWYS